MGDPGLAFGDIGRVLTGRGYRLTDDVYSESDFGSRYLVYRGGNQDIRLVWDGKEESLIVQAGNAAEDVWRDLGVEKVGRGMASQENIAALKAALDEVK
jgi:hypothetical protein